MTCKHTTMKNSFLILGIALCLVQGIEAQEETVETTFSPERGMLLQASIDANPEFWSDWKLTAGYTFKFFTFYASYERYNPIDFEAFYIGFVGCSQPFVNVFDSKFLDRISTGLGGYAGVVNGHGGVGIFVEGSFWITPRMSIGLQEVLSQNISLGGYGETRALITFILW